MPVSADFSNLLRKLSEADVKFIVIGGMAMVSHGSAFVTADLDVCYEWSISNCEAVARALAPLDPHLRGAPRELPFRLDAPTLKAGLNFTLETNAGDIDLIGEVRGMGGYEDLLAGSVEYDLYGLPVRIMGIDDLIRAKKDADRDKDRIHLRELRELKKRYQG